MREVDVFWSFRSPYSYLATPGILEIRENYDVRVNIRVVLPIAIRSPDILFTPESLNKVKYIQLDWERRAEFLGMPHAWPSPDPVVMDIKNFSVPQKQPYIYWLSCLGVEAQRRGRGPEFVAEVSRLIFGGTRNWHQDDHLASAASRAGLNLGEMDASISDDASHMREIEDNQQMLADAGHWGVPTLVVDGEPFFGQDRIETLKWKLSQMGLEK
ncbi:2-hydroxychromene-2-carboxylate isomerase [Marinobacter daqiaonensis]|uniref:2-hydroxychromene-2-carboxylate isomerase n=1 Tax=Marinobacter daqiaonensis TaxID=650891 RepID=A0A1I6I8E0_9GAMM|nr:DsbA family protein [Marinobacter daqiaonensis]SFR62650.1 2-hydroxychromene-2-carboxylate isomerase [Marinobacter daqiaonensis]